jgi:prevent-host-death family protein
MADARARLAELVDRVRRTREPVTLTRNGRPAVVLVDPDEWALVCELSERVEDEIDARAYDAAVAEHDGSTATHAEILADLAEDESRVARPHRAAG